MNTTTVAVLRLALELVDITEHISLVLAATLVQQTVELVVTEVVYQMVVVVLYAMMLVVMLAVTVAAQLHVLVALE